MKNINRETKEELKEHITDYLDELKGYASELYGCYLHNEIFNTDYYIIGTYKAEQWLNKYGVFKAINEIKEYEQDNFGQVNTDLSDPEKVVNMIVYILGEKILAESKRLKNKWDDYLTDEDLAVIKKEIEEL